MAEIASIGVKKEPTDSIRVKRESDQRTDKRNNERRGGAAQDGRQNRNRPNRNQPRFLVSGEV